MAARSILEVRDRFNRARQRKNLWNSILSDAYELFLPQRNLYFDTGSGDPTTTPGQRKTANVYDSTPQVSLMRFANRVQNDLMPPGKRVLSLEAGPLVPEELRDQVNDKLFQINEQMFAVMQGSNIDNAIGELLLDWGIGTGCLLTQAGDGVTTPLINYVAVPASTVLLEAGPWGTINGIYRELRVKLDDITGWWRDFKEPQEYGMIPANKRHAHELKLIEATYMVDETWYYDIIDPSIGTDGHRGVSRAMDGNPWVTPRYLVVAGETEGRGPAIQALPDAKVINKIAELFLKAASLRIQGVWTGVNDGVLNPNNVRVIPGAVIPVGSNGGARGPSLMRVDPPGDLNLAELSREELRNQIRQFMLDNSLPPEGGAVRSATEIIERVKQLAADIGAPYGRLYNELIVPLVQATLRAMKRAGLLDIMPKVNGLTVKVVVQSPLALEQNLNDVETLVQWLQVIGSIDPNMLRLGARIEDVPEWIARKMGVDPALFRTKGERIKLQQQMAAMAAQAQGIPTGGGPAPDAGVPQIPAGAGGAAAGLPLAA